MIVVSVTRSAWSNLGDLDQTTAAENYIAAVTKLLPSWRDEKVRSFIRHSVV